MNLDETRLLIRQELEAMRKAGTRRQELSLHACKRLFFDLGVRPTMAAVRDLTQIGSASDIPKDIDHFWERIRNVSKIRIGTGAIPPALEEKAGELLGALFEEAQAYARAELDNERATLHESRHLAEQQAHDAAIRLDETSETMRRAEEKTQLAWERIRKLETELVNAQARHDALQETRQALTQRASAENTELREQLQAEQAANTALRDRIETLHNDLRDRTEHYAQQIKEAVDAAERRVKPMLVELDALRGMAATYQSGVRDANRKEFDFLQQLALTKAQADRFGAQVDEQAEELDVLTKELARLRMQPHHDPAVTALLYSLARDGRLTAQELDAIGTAMDNQIPLLSHCPKCDKGEPELVQTNDQHELICPECEHSSGARSSRLDAVAHFFSPSPSALS
ncbi:DNA-binding protein [Paraburkholderia hayleyella]|uniref:DNA-binding protein n=1 Tax=Paraburkholderia hayleyella TaxID=2152889 RepID=UPI00129205F4|nr:DNA-binding protein [Paraburkholderia hayleyella]